MQASEKAKEPNRYHHGDLRQALLVAAEQELVDKGVDAFSLRGTAKRAGVSHAAPAHHFKDAMALLDTVAAVGFDRLTRTMREEQAEAGIDKQAQFIGAGIGYVRFALENPDMLQLMFGTSRRASNDPALAASADAAFSVLVNAVRTVRGSEAFKGESGWRDVAAAWSMVHGYAQLAISGKMAFATQRDFTEQRNLIADILGRALPEGNGAS
jgi:AcrR family transcriptional regulator